MATDTQWATAVLDEAATIVVVEWMRLNQDEQRWEGEVAGMLAELPVARPSRPRIGLTIGQCRRTGDSNPDDPRPAGPRRRPAHHVWATQHSPP
jgi:hypothetical protein